MAASISQHLNQDFTIPLRDPVWHHIYLSAGLLRVVQSPEFHQLSRIKQLGPSHLVYPGATHTRYNHSIGVFYLARRILVRLLESPTCPKFSLAGGKAFLCAALVHDLGHFPYTHSLKELPLKEHEVLTGEIVRSPGLSAIIRDEVGTDPDMVAAIVDTSLATDNWEVAFFRKILSGPLDPDKLDYLTRDAYFCGVPYGTQDIDFILSRIRPAAGGGIALEESGISSLEHLLFSKYLMYRSVYWHRLVRVATGMIKKALHLGLSRGKIDPESLYHLDDEGFSAGFSAQGDFPPFQLIQAVRHGRLYSLAGETPFRNDSRLHQHLTGLEKRKIIEDRLRERISQLLGKEIEEHEIILDIPESVSFEVNMPILTKDGVEVAYPGSRTVFTPRVVEEFTQTLRILRLSLPKHLQELLASKAPDFDLRQELEQLAPAEFLR